MAQTGDGKNFNGTGGSKYPNLKAGIFQRAVQARHRRHGPARRQRRLREFAVLLHVRRWLLPRTASTRWSARWCRAWMWSTSSRKPRRSQAARHRSGQDGEGAGRLRHQVSRRWRGLRQHPGLGLRPCCCAVGRDGAAPNPGRSTTSAKRSRRFRTAGSRRRRRAPIRLDITVIVSLTATAKSSATRITYESEQATDNDRLLYRIAVMEALQRCTPMPFTESMAGAVAGRPFAIQFQNRKPPPQPTEKRAWLTPKIL